MRKMRSGISLFILTIVLIAALSGLASAQDNDLYVRFAHLSPQAPAVDLYAAEKMVVKNLAFKGLSDYMPMGMMDTPEIRVVPANGSPDQAVTGKPFKLALPPAGYVTVVMIGSPDDNTFELFTLPLDARAAGSVTVGSLVITGAYARATQSGMMAEGTPEAGAMGGMHMAGMGDNSAVYMLIQNTGPAADKLVSAATDAAKIAEIHQSMVEDGMAKMKPVEGGLEIPAGGNVELKPGGYHVMLMDVTRPLRPGDSLALVLKFASGVEARLTAPIVDLAGKS